MNVAVWIIPEDLVGKRSGNGEKRWTPTFIVVGSLSPLRELLPPKFKPFTKQNTLVFSLFPYPFAPKKSERRSWSCQ